jgi:hypothetical protein
MELLIGLALGVALLYVWLAGHWFGRVLMFLLLAGIIGGLLAIAATPPDLHGAGNPMGFAGFAAGTVLAWFVASIPIYCKRGRARQDARPKAFAYPLHWTLGEIDAYERDHPIAAAEYRRAGHFLALPSA